MRYAQHATPPSHYTMVSYAAHVAGDTEHDNCSSRLSAGPLGGARACARHGTAYRRVLDLWMEARVGRRRLAGDVRGALLHSVQDGHGRPRRAGRLLGCRVRVDHAAATVLFGRGRGVSGSPGPSVKPPGRGARVLGEVMGGDGRGWGGRLSPRHGQGGSASRAAPCRPRAARWGTGASSGSASGRSRAW